MSASGHQDLKDVIDPCYIQSACFQLNEADEMEIRKKKKKKSFGLGTGLESYLLPAKCT